MANKMANLEASLDSLSEGNSNISDFMGFTEQDLADNISKGVDSEPNSSDIEVSSIGSSDISDFGESEDETVNGDANVLNVPQGISWKTILRMSSLIHLNKTVAPIYL